MTNSKHTPTPWHVDIGQIDKAWLKGRLQEAVFAGDTPIAICSDNRANARLIASAPDLYSALQNLLQAAQNPLGNLEDAMEEAQNAISKAEGKA